MSAATADKVVRQIEFYFSDSNLPRDRFMLERVHENPEGYVDLGLIATFARMRDILKVRLPCVAATPLAGVVEAPCAVPRVHAAQQRRNAPHACKQEQP